MKLNLTYSPVKKSVAVRNEIVEIKPYQIVMVVSITDRGLMEWDPKTPQFPAILDTGNNHNFSISEDHLIRWAGIRPESLTEQKQMREAGHRVPLRTGAVWLHGDEPYRLDLDEGIAVITTGGPRLPLLGLRALTRNKLRALIRGDQLTASIWAPKWYWPF